MQDSLNSDVCSKPLAETGRPLKPISLWLMAKSLSDISAAISVIVVSLYAFALTGNPFLLGVLLALRVTGSVCGAVLAPMLARRMANFKITISCDLGNALLAMTIALIPASFAVPALYCFVFCAGCLQGCYRVIMISQAPDILGYHHRHKMNAILGAIDGMAVVVGGLSASFIYALLPVSMIFAINGLLFALAATTVLSIRKHLGFGTSFTASHSRPAAMMIFRFPFRSAATIVKVSMAAFGLALAGRFIEACGSGTHNVGLPLISADYKPQNPALLFGWLIAAWGLGRAASTIVTPRFLSALDRAGRPIAPAFFICLILTFCFFALIFEHPSLALGVGLALLAGFFDSATETSYHSMLQAHQGVDKTSIIGFSHFLERVGLGLGILLAGQSFATLGDQMTSRIIYGAGILAAVLLLVASIKAKDRTEFQQPQGR